MDLDYSVYMPEDDSKLLLKNCIEILNSNKDSKDLLLCEVGVGSGYVIDNLSKKFPDLIYYGTDINPDAIKLTSSKLKNNLGDYNLIKTNLLDNINLKFDYIIFNTPYLPCERNEKYSELKIIDKAIYGGKNGYEIIIEFLHQLLDRLKFEGTCLMICSTLSKPNIIEKYMKRLHLDFQVIDSENSFFEKILCYKITKKQNLNFIEKYNIKNISPLSKGKHSSVFEGTYKNIRVIIKIGLPEHITSETFFSNKLEGKYYTSKILFSEPNYIIKEKIEGDTIKEFLEKENSKEKVILILNKCIEICLDLDSQKINKKEMTNPYKHIFIDSNLNVKMIDFERCIFSEKPQNTTQFLQYIYRNIPILKSKGILISISKLRMTSLNLKKSNVETKILIEDLLV